MFGRLIAGINKLLLGPVDRDIDLEAQGAIYPKHACFPDKNSLSAATSARQPVATRCTSADGEKALNNRRQKRSAKTVHEQKNDNNS